MKLYGLKNCDTCRKAIKALQETGRTIEFIDIRAANISRQRIEKWLQASGADRVLNKRGITWRALSSEDKAIAQGVGLATLLEASPALIKRPVIERDDGTITVGWTKDIQAELGL
ncbi:MAG: Spx/MgsR family RNA polymerase-binding regulatory protein [bacterium]